MNDPKKSLSYMLGDMNAKLDFLVKAEEARQGTDKEVDDRLTSLEQSRFKANFIVATVAATVGFIFSNLKDGMEWVKTLFSNQA